MHLNIHYKALQIKAPAENDLNSTSIRHLVVFPHSKGVFRLEDYSTVNPCVAEANRG